MSSEPKTSFRDLNASALSLLAILEDGSIDCAPIESYFDSVAKSFGDQRAFKEFRVEFFSDLAITHYLRNCRTAVNVLTTERNEAILRAAINHRFTTVKEFRLGRHSVGGVQADLFDGGEQCAEVVYDSFCDKVKRLVDRLLQPREL